MKKLFMILSLLAGLGLGPAANARAAPIDFGIDGPNSNVSVTGTWLGTISPSLDADLDSPDFFTGGWGKLLV